MAADSPDLYSELGVGRDASPEDIKRAHRKAVREHHPDRGGDKAKFQAVQLAYDTLKDGERRRRYDETGETGNAQAPDPAVQMLSMIVENLIGQMIQEDAPIETADMRQMMVDCVAGKIRELKAERHKATRSLEKAARLARRWKRKRKAKGPDLIGETIRRRERDLKEALKRMGEAIEAWQGAAKLLDDYEYEFEAAPAWTGPTSTARPFRFGQIPLG